jgi:hypothetical protein
VVFIDESKTAAQDASSPDSGPDEFDDAVWGSPLAASEDSSAHQTPLLPARITPSRPRSPTDRFLISSPKWPLANEVEAYLFRHFVEKLAIWVMCPATRCWQSALYTTGLADSSSLSLTCATRNVRLGSTLSSTTANKGYKKLSRSRCRGGRKAVPFC